MSGKSPREEFDHSVLEIARVTRVVKGGRRFRFRAIVVTGDRAGRVGIGVAKSSDVSGAINKAFLRGKRSVFGIPIHEGTIPHEVRESFGASSVMLRPARKGRGLIAGGAVRTVCDLAGIHDLTAKVLSRSGNKLNVARATLRALQSLKPFHAAKKHNETNKPTDIQGIEEENKRQEENKEETHS